MQIPYPLHQFKKNPTLFIISGDYESKFLVASNSTITQKENLKLTMREEGKEKQAYNHSNPSPEKMGSVSHYGAYKEDLEEKFYKSIQKIVYNLIYDENIEEIYLFAPPQRINGIYSNLKKRAQNKVKAKINGEYIKQDPIKILKIWEEKYLPKNPEIHYSQEEKKIMEKPKAPKKKKT